MNTHASRRQLLVAESELNRAQLVGEIRVLKADVRALAHAATSWGPIASAAAVMVLGLASFRRNQAAAAAARSNRAQ